MGNLGKRLVSLSGPSCGGKGPLLAAAAEFFQETPFSMLSVIKCRESRGGAARPDEHAIWDDPNYFRTRAEIEGLSGPRYLHATSHGFPQVLDLERIVSAPTPLVILEASQQVARQLSSSSYLGDVDVTTVFVSPLSAEEIARLRCCQVNVEEYLKGLGVQRLLARAEFHGRTVDDAFLADVAVRAGDAVEELRAAHHFDGVLVGRAGEGSSQWNRDLQGRFLGPPVGEAAATLATFVELLEGRRSPSLEEWTAPPF